MHQCQRKMNVNVVLGFFWGKSFFGEDMLCCFTRFREQSFFIIFTFYVEFQTKFRRK